MTASHPGSHHMPQPPNPTPLPLDPDLVEEPIRRPPRSTGFGFGRGCGEVVEGVVGFDDEDEDERSGGG
jgi:hypothetical protein